LLAKGTLYPFALCAIRNAKLASASWIRACQ
jgi:hypothetical protein